MRRAPSSNCFTGVQGKASLMCSPGSCREAKKLLPGGERDAFLHRSLPDGIGAKVSEIDPEIEATLRTCELNKVSRETLEGISQNLHFGIV